MKAVTVLIIAFASVMFAQQQPSTSDNHATGPAQEKKATPPPSGTTATLYVYRLRDVSGMLNKPSVYIDEREIARLANGRFFGVNVDPGQHVVRSTEKNSSVTLDMKAGQVYYIRLAFEPTRYTIRPETTLVRPEQAWAEMGQTKTNDPKEIKNHELAFVDSMPPRPVATPENADECRSIAVTLFSFPAPGGYKVVDVFNYPDAYIGKVYQANALQAVQSRDRTKILVLTKGYTPEDVATAHNFCHSGPEMVEGTLARGELQADIKNKISTIDAVDHPNCAPQIVKQWRSPRNPGEERWEVKSCDTTSSWNVLMVPSPRGGTDFQVNKIDQEQKKKPDTVAAPPVDIQTGTAEASPKEQKAMSLPATGTPEGFVLFEGRKEQFTIAIPKDWTAYDQARRAAASGDRRLMKDSFNMIIFYRSPGPAAKDDWFSEEVMRKVENGEIPAFFVQNLRAQNGMSCGGFTEKAQKNVLKLVSSESAFSRGATITEAPHAEPVPVAGCQGIRVRGSGRARQSSTATVYDVYATSDGKVLYLFTLTVPAEKLDKNSEVFQKAMATAKLAVAP